MEERKLVTVLFADITGSTTLDERFDPERWRVLLQRFFSVMTSTIEAWGGTVLALEAKGLVSVHPTSGIAGATPSAERVRMRLENALQTSR